ncbi:GlsB/YeaQ/YmgE family stress response membrane protein [Parvularcula maris]|uniref:GlsB/YeaQ/YmgE family stress response membrane protein n=1 Tax=Parvularcula maris TaxID=2965077 RepID=A0A9X2RHF5_9PROT|nr:GlsB/YeaQ/YmgE family stress response membrane protein [Parvularcula maris]MCQ8184890.1 GlsB/YeaQ/YmgE family stress response membrane protein [Parvularcula maris]
MNWIVAIIVGGLAGWIAEKLMKSNMGLLMNIVLGIVGAFVANLIMAAAGIAIGGIVGYLIAGIIGACLLIFVARLIKGRGATRTH